jgi:two-component system, chemotaxis family, chemotaxis protein CheY
MFTFLVVDDSPTLRKMIISALKPLNASFSEAASGLEAIEKLAVRSHDAVTLDLNMPDMHGLEFLQFVRNHSAFRNLPILVVTTRSDNYMLVKAMEAGADGYLVKPFKPADLLNQMKNLLSLSHLND